MTNSRKNRFGFDSIDDIPVGKAPRRRGTGPMSTAVRETAETLQDSTEALVETRQRNASDARTYREALSDGLVLSRIALDEILVDNLPRDRLDLDTVAASDEMDELIASIRAYGQKEPIEVFTSEAGVYHLKKGWRRLKALRRLYDETGSAEFSTVLARIDATESDRLRHYVEMVEENILREDLTFAEMAHLAITASSDAAVQSAGVDVGPDAMVNRLYGSLHKTKRSYIRSFVGLLTALGDSVKYPKSIGRDLGVSVARKLAETPEAIGPLRAMLMAGEGVDAQTAALQSVLMEDPSARAPVRRDNQRMKTEFHVGSAKITARKGEVRIKDSADFAGISRQKLQEAVQAFQRVLERDDGEVTDR